MTQLKNLSLASLHLCELFVLSPAFHLGEGSESFCLSNSDFSKSFASLIISNGNSHVFVGESRFHLFLSSPLRVENAVQDITFNTHQDFSANTTVSVLRCQFANISSTERGSAIYVSNADAYVTIDSTTFTWCETTLSGASGTFVVLYSISVTLQNSVFLQCSASSDIASFHIAAQAYPILNTSVSGNADVNCGTYGVTGGFDSVSGGHNAMSLKNQNCSNVYASLSAAGPGIATSTSSAVVEFLKVFNCQGCGLMATFEYSGALAASLSMFVNNSIISGGWVFTRTNAVSLTFEKCSFCNTTSTTLCWGTSGSLLIFDNCCFDAPISSAYVSINTFLSTRSYPCLPLLTSSFTSVFGQKRYLPISLYCMVLCS